MSEKNISEAKSCSKYSLWVVYSGLAEKFTTFADTMEKIKEIRMETIKSVKRETKLENLNQTKKEEKTEEVLETAK